jgi:hypothetical protein
MLLRAGLRYNGDESIFCKMNYLARKGLALAGCLSSRK